MQEKLEKWLFLILFKEKVYIIVIVIILPLFMALIALKLFFPTNFKIVPPGLPVVADLLLLYSLSTLDHPPTQVG